MLRREDDRKPRKTGLRRVGLLLLALAIGVLGLAWVSGGPVPMRIIAKDVSVDHTAPADQVEQ